MSLGCLGAARPGRTLMLCGHMDTVGVDGMTDPFVPSDRDGRLYGRGTLDMKSGVAAMVCAATEMADPGWSRGGPPRRGGRCRRGARLGGRRGSGPGLAG